MFTTRIRSRHPSHDPLRDMLPKQRVRSVVRLGSTTEVVLRKGTIEVNTVEAIKNSANKLRMKNCFQEGTVKTAEWVPASTPYKITKSEKTNQMTGSANGKDFQIHFPIVAKNIYGSRGKGNTLLKTPEDLQKWMQGKQLENYIFEKFYSYNKEYRLHVTANGCFYTCRKMLKEDTPENERWFRNDSNSVWIREENEQFDKPKCWDAIVAECVKALNACGLDFGACDVRVQSAKNSKEKDRKEVNFIIIEINSAPSFGDVTLERYIAEIPKIITSKAKK